MAKKLREKYDEKLHVLVPKSNTGNFTYDGIELGGERVCMEIEEELERLEKEGQQIKRFSIIGYSLGGLVARYTVGVLHSKGFFDKIKPVVCSLFSWSHLSIKSRIELRNFRNSSSRSEDPHTRMAQQCMERHCRSYSFIIWQTTIYNRQFPRNRKAIA